MHTLYVHCIQTPYVFTPPLTTPMHTRSDVSFPHTHTHTHTHPHRSSPIPSSMSSSSCASSRLRSPRGGCQSSMTLISSRESQSKQKGWGLLAHLESFWSEPCHLRVVLFNVEKKCGGKSLGNCVNAFCVSVVAVVQSLLTTVE